MLLERFGKELLFFDGGMGTELQKNGLKKGELPELLNIHSPEIVKKVHKSYLDAGCDIITTNTFGANSLKFSNVEEIITNAVNIVKESMGESGRKAYIALDVGPLGKLLTPYGDLPFEDAYNLFKEQVIAGEKAGADLVLIETMGDLYEIKAAVLAAKENTALPIFVSMIFDKKGTLLTGADVKTLDQPYKTPNGTLTENGKFFDAATAYKNAPESIARVVKVYEKIKDGIWVYNGFFYLTDAWTEKSDGRTVFKFQLEMIEDDETAVSTGETQPTVLELEHNRLIPTAVKVQVWKRDKGCCVKCGSNTNLHYDHIIPFSRGGSSSMPENIQLLCASCNLKKSDHIE